MKLSLPFTYRDVLNRLATQSDLSDDSVLEQQLNSLAAPLNLAPFASFVVDYPTRHYRSIGENAGQVMGHPVEAFWEGGLEFMLYHYHDFGLSNTEMFPDEVNFLDQHPSICPNEVRFTKSYRFKRSDGAFNVILQQFTYCILAGQGIPFASLGFTWDVTDIAEPGKLIHKIEYLDRASGLWNLHRRKEYYPERHPDQLLSNREIEVLKWIADGFASKEIADRLSLSFNTVNTHRRNMLRKTNSRNTSDLLRFALENRLL